MVKCHCIFTRPLLFTVQLWPSPRTFLSSKEAGTPLPVQPPNGNQLLCLPSAQTLARATTLEPQQRNTLELFSTFTAPEKANGTATTTQQQAPGGQRGCSSCASRLVCSSVSFGPFSAQLLIINNSVYLYQNHYLNWLHDTYHFPNCTPGKICYKICDFVLCNYPSMGYKTLHLCLK